MKKFTVFLVATAAFVQLYAQGPKFYLDNTLVFKDKNAQQIPYPFVGGLVSPQFSNIDLNADGTKDLFVFDKGGNKVLTYIRNTGAGAEWIYAPQYEFGFPKMVYWALLVDYNGDGKEDIFTAADPTQIGQAVAVYKNISANGIPAFELVAPTLQYDQNIQGLPLGDIFWVNDDISAISDVDNDGDIDVLSFDASGSSITMYGNEAKEKGYPLDSLVFRAYDECWGGFSESVVNRSIKLGADCFGGRYYPKSGAHSGSTMLLLDMDNDTDKDLVLGDISFAEVTLLINGKKNTSWPYDSMISYDTVFPRNTTQGHIYNFPGAYYADVTNDHVNDLLMSPNMATGGKNLNQVWCYKNNGTNTNPSFSFVKNNFLQENMVDFGSGTAPVFFDVDGDGDKDLILATRGDFEQTLNTADRLELYRNIGNKTKAEFKYEGTTNYLGLIKDSIRDMKPTFGDLDGDGKPDMLAGDADGHLWFYKNNSSGANLSLDNPVKNYMKIDIGFGAAPQIIDLDADGLLDLAIGTGGGFIDFFKNKGTATAPMFDSIPTIDTIGHAYINEFFWYKILNTSGQVIDSVRQYDFSGYATPHFADLDENGKLDLLVGTQGGAVRLFTGIEGHLNDSFTENDTFVFNEITKKYGSYRPGVRNVPLAVKLSDSNGTRPVIVLGNFRGGINFLNAKPGLIKIGIHEFYRELNVSLFPNPTSGQLYISRSLQQYDGALLLSLTDMLGRNVYEGRMANGESNSTIYTGGLENGIYYLRLTDGHTYQTTQKITVLK